MVWVSGPPGAGKTILASSYVESRGRKCLWYRLDAADADLATFFYYMSLAAKSVSPRKKKSLPLLTPEYLPNVNVFSRRFFEGLSSILKAPACIVLDNYHEVAEPAFDEAIREGLESLPKGISVMILSRTDMPQSFARMRANSTLETLDWSDLRLTREESLGITRLRNGGKISKGEAAEIHRKTDGWAAGLALVLEKSKKGGIDLKAQGTVALDMIFDYFSSEIIDKLESVSREFLLRTSVLPHMDARMAEELTGVAQAGQILMSFCRKNYFTEKRTHGATVFQYHALFREFLMSRAKEFFSKAEFSELLAKAASILEESGQVEDAFGLMRETGDMEGISRLVLKHAQALLLQGRYMVLRTWLSSLPEKALRGSPWLIYWLGACSLPFDPSRSLGEFKSAFMHFKELGDPPGAFLSWCGIINAIHFESKDYRQYDKWIPAGFALTREFGVPKGEIGTAVATSMCMTLFAKSQRSREFALWEKRAIKFSENCFNIDMKTQILVSRVMRRLVSGDYEKMAEIIGDLRTLARSAESTPLTALTTRWLEATYFIFTASHEKCLAVVRDGLELAERSGVHIMDCMLFGPAALSALNAGDRHNAEKFLKLMRECEEDGSLLDRSLYYFLLSHDDFLNGDMDRARSNVELSLTLTRQIGLPLGECFGLIEAAHIMHRVGEGGAALKYLEEARTIAEEIGSSDKKFLCFLTDAHFAFEDGKPLAGTEALRKALALGRERGYVNTFMWFPSVMAGLCRKALEAGIETEYVRGLIKKRGIAAGPFDPDRPCAIKIYTMGRFEFLKDGKSVQFSGKVKKPLELLKAIISFGGRDVPESSLTDALWPEADGDAAHSAFGTTLHRLRRLAGVENLIEMREGRATLNARCCWVDAWALDWLLTDADLALKAGEDGKAQCAVESAVELYHGHFLASEADKPWLVSFRERLKRKIIPHIEDLGRRYEKAGEYKKASRSYEKGIDVDGLVEIFYRRLMVCRQKLGQRAEAITVYNRLKKNLSTELGIAPSEKTEKVYRSLILR